VLRVITSNVLALRVAGQAPPLLKNVGVALLIRTKAGATVKLHVLLALESLQPRLLAQHMSATVSVQKLLIMSTGGQATQTSRDVKDAHAVPIKTWSVIKSHAIPAVQGHIHGIMLRHVLSVVKGNIQDVELHHVLPVV
jgi:hypothetical protein